MVLFAFISLQAPYAHRAYIRSIANDSVVQIFGAQGSGTGSHVKLPNGKVVILTNNHICNMPGPLNVKVEGLKNPVVRNILKREVINRCQRLENPKLVVVYPVALAWANRDNAALQELPILR